MPFTSKVFETRNLQLAGTTEKVVVGGRDKFHLLPKAFDGMRQIGVIGWGSQGPAQAQNLRDSLAGTGIKVKVGLRAGSSSKAEAEAAGFTEKNGTLGEMFEVISGSDLVILLIADSAQVELYRQIMAKMKPGATFGLSHGFLLGHLQSKGEKWWREDINVVGVCPKGMGPSVRRLYEQGKEVNGAGINCSFAVDRDVDGRATDIALGWAVAIGAPYIFETSLEMEYRSDIFGERGILLGAVHGIVEALYRHMQELMPDTRIKTLGDAFCQSVEAITGPISMTISRTGLKTVYQLLNEEDRRYFEKSYPLAYAAAYPLLAEIYDEVRSGNEIRSVILAGARLEKWPMQSVETTEMWEVGKEVRDSRQEFHYEVNGLTAGVYLGVMMAQVDLLREHGHCWSEVVNESIIESVDSLNPYMHAKGVSHMIDNCSTTARLGARKWGPRFDHVISQQVLAFFLEDAASDRKIFEHFLAHPVHDALKVCGELRPAVDISVMV